MANEIYLPTLDLIFEEEAVDLEVMEIRASAAVGDYKRLFALHQAGKDKINEKQVQRAARVAEALVAAYYKEKRRIERDCDDEEEAFFARFRPGWFPESGEDVISYSTEIVPYQNPGDPLIKL